MKKTPVYSFQRESTYTYYAGKGKRTVFVLCKDGKPINGEEIVCVHEKHCICDFEERHEQICDCEEYDECPFWSEDCNCPMQTLSTIYSSTASIVPYINLTDFHDAKRRLVENYVENLEKKLYKERMWRKQNKERRAKEAERLALKAAKKAKKKCVSHSKK